MWNKAMMLMWNKPITHGLGTRVHVKTWNKPNYTWLLSASTQYVE